MNEEELKNVAMAFNTIKQAAESSTGSLQYHQQLQNALNIVATFIQEEINRITEGAAKNSKFSVEDISKETAEKSK